MRVTVEVPEELFRTPKTAEQIESDLRQAAAIFWLARGEVSPEAVPAITEPARSPGAAEGTLMDLLMSMPNVGDDADFERPVEYPRESPAWDT